MVRSWPNIALTGTPGTGKSTHAVQILARFASSSDGIGGGAAASASGSGSGGPLRHMDMGQIVKANGFHAGYDTEWKTYDVDEEPLLDYLEPFTGGHAPEPLDDDDEESGAQSNTAAGEEEDPNEEARGGLILDWHSVEAYPERWVDLVVVLRCDHELLWKRLEKRDYPLKKIQENNEAEIMEVVLAEARDSYPIEAIVELRSETTEDVENNVERIVQWIHAWRKQRGFPPMQSS